MRLAISNILWPASQDQAALARASRLCLDGIEVAPTCLAPWDELTDSFLDTYRAKLKDLDLVVPSFQALFFGKPEATLLGEASAYETFHEHLKRVSHIATKLGATRLVFGAPKNRRRETMTYDDAFALATERLRPVAESLHAQGVALVIEPVPEAYGADFIVNTSQAADLVRAVDHPGVRLHMDTGALTMTEADPHKLVAEHHDILAHVHLSRPLLAPLTPDEKNDRTLAAALKSHGYKGWLSIEIKTQPDPLDCLSAAVSYARRVFLEG